MKTQKIVEHAGTGMAMPESLAFRLDDLAKSLPKDFGYCRLASTPSECKAEEGEDGKTDVSVVSTDHVDRDGEVILPGGLDLNEFRQNPVVAWAHDYSQLPLGKAKWIRPKGNGLIAMTQFARKPQGWTAPWMPDAVHSMEMEGMCTGKSIGFLPTSARAATTEELQRRPDWKDADRIIDKGILLEYSCVPVPANGNALTVSVSKAMKQGRMDQATADFLQRSIETFKTNKTIIILSGKSMSTETNADAKAMGTTDNATGGNVTPSDGTQPIENVPDCPKCLSAENVKPMHGDAGKYFQCSVCGARFKDDGSEMDDEPEAEAEESLVSKTVIPDEPNDPDKDGDLDPIVSCPLCREAATQGDNVEVPGLGACDTYKCEKCGNTFIQPEPAHRAPETAGTQDGTPRQNEQQPLPADQKAAGGKTLNTACESRAMGLAKNGKVSDAPWEAPNGGDRKEDDCLGRREGKDVPPSEKFTDPVIKDGTLYRRAVANVEARESGSAIGEAAKRIMAALQEKKAAKPFIRPETIAAAVERKRAELHKSLAKQIGPLVAAELDRRRGRV